MKAVLFAFLLLSISLSATADSLVLHNATVIDGTGGPARPGVDVIVRGERIERLCDASACEHPKGARVIDATGKYVLPGFVDMHAHILSHPWDEKGELAPREDRATTLALLKTMLRFGVTTIRDTGAQTEIAVAYRRLLAERKIEGPTLFTAGRIIHGSNFNPEPFQPVHTAAEVRDEIRWQAKNGVDVIKIYASMPLELTAVAIEEAHAIGLPIIGHLQRTTWTAAAKLGIDGVEHVAPWSEEYVASAARAGYRDAGRTYWLEHLDQQAIDEMIAAMAKHHVTYDATLMAMRTKMFGDDPRYTKSPDLRFTPELLLRGWPTGSFTKSWTSEDYAQAKKAWPILESIVRRMYERGVRIVVGTDTPTPWIVPGASVHDEMALLRDAGIPAAEVIRMATSNAAAALRKSADFGGVKAGLRADLVVLDADPVARIENTRSIRMVIQRGRIVADGPPEK